MQFLFALKALLRSSLAICVFSVPELPASLLSLIQHTSDIVVRMQSFVGSRIDISEFKEYTGFFTLVKLPRLNSLTVNFAPDSLQYAFKIKKRKMYIEKMHMPPEESRDASNPERPRYREGSVNDIINKAPSMGMGCATGGVGIHKNDLDF
jgi:elongator complex protein 4